MMKTAEEVAEDTLDVYGVDVLDALEEQSAIDRRAIWALMTRAIDRDRQQRERRGFALVANASSDVPTIVGYYQSRMDAEILAADWNRRNGSFATYTVEPGEDW